MITNRIFLSTT